MRILLINPPPRYVEQENIIVPPLGLAYLAAVLRQGGFIDVEILDAFAQQQTWPEFEAAVQSKQADLIGLTGMTPVIDNTLRAARVCRKYCRYLVAGGPHVTAQIADIFRQIPELDYAVYGEGEQTFLELAQKLASGLGVEDVAGLATPKTINNPRSLCQDIDSLPFPSRDLLPNHRYRYALSVADQVTTMFTSRGCPYQCNFCDKAVFGSHWRPRSAENVVAEIVEVVERYHISSIIFYDDLFTVDKRRVIDICRQICEKKLAIDWKCEGRVNNVDDEMLQWMKQAGCSMVAYGVESANQHGLDYLNKRTTPAQIKQAFAITSQAGIKTMGYFILGIPVETYEDALRTIAFAIEIKADYAQFSILSPLPGTAIYREAIAKGWYRETTATNPMDKDLKRPAIVCPEWSEARLKQIVKVAHRRFYLRPGYIIKKLTEVSNGKQLLRMVSTAIRVLKQIGRK